MTTEQKHSLNRVLKRRLNSCHKDYIREAMIWGAVLSDPESIIEEWMLDSGAFTAWSRGDVVSLNQVMESYDKALETMTRTDVKVWLINLDVIPGRRGVDPSPAELEAAVKQSDINFEILNKRYGDIVLPVFHQGEDEKRLKEVLAQSAYIGVSPRNDLGEPLRVAWSRQVHQMMKKLGKGRSHGLAATGSAMVSQVSWWSVDSASWLYSAAMGSIDILIGGKLRTIAISDRSPQMKNRDQHYDNLASPQRDMIRATVEELGFTLEGLSTTANMRVALCAVMNQRWADKMTSNNSHQDFLFPL